MRELDHINLNDYYQRLTKVLFDINDEKEYKKHVRREEKLLREKADDIIFRNGYEQWFLDQRMQIKTVEDIRQFCIREWDKIYKCYCWPHKFDIGDRNTKPFRLIDIRFSGMRYREKARNTHACPRGDKTQWGGDSTYPDGTLVPRGRPGLEGNITIVYSRDYSGFKSNLLSSVGIHTGTGGGRGGEDGYYKYCYDVVMFMADWEGMQDIVDQYREINKEDNVIRKLKGLREEAFNPTSFLVK